MASDPPRQPTDPGRTDPDPSSASDPSSRVDRLRRWLSTYALHVETLLAAGSIGLGVVAVPILIFGIFAALPSDAPSAGSTDPGTPILDAGAVVGAASLALVLALAVAVLAHRYVEVRDRDPSSTDELDALTVVAGGTRIVETLAAVTLLVGVPATVASLAQFDRVPDALGLLVAIAGVLLPVVVLGHAAGAFLGSLLGIGDDGEGDPATVG
jgi:hypothetical protein